MSGRDARLELQAQAQARRAEQDALSEAQAAAEAMRDARTLNDATLLAMGARRAARINPDLLPERWAAWVRNIRAAQT